MPGPGYSSVLRVKYDLSVKLLAPNLITKLFILYDALQSHAVYEGM